MRVTGSSVPSGFQASPGAIGSVATAATSSTVWITVSARLLDSRVRKCA